MVSGERLPLDMNLALEVGQRRRNTQNQASPWHQSEMRFTWFIFQTIRLGNLTPLATRTLNDCKTFSSKFTVVSAQVGNQSGSSVSSGSN